MKKSLLIVCALSLSACAPQLSLGGTKADDQLIVTKPTSEAQYTNFAFVAGSEKAVNLLMYIGGKELKYNDTRCRAVGSGIGCELGDVEPGKRVSVNVSGSDLSGSVKYNRASGAAFNYRFY